MMFIKKKRMMEVFPSSWRNLWTEWQLRGLILLSLTTQIALVILGNRRKYIAGTWIRFTVWSAYLLADSIAIMAAGIISNDVGDVYNNTGGFLDAKYELKTFWAPLLLLHLGGTDAITAYSLEDNELWKRHSIGVVIQAMATLYILLTAWTSSLVSLLFIMMFFVGLMKYCERVWVLYSASEKKFKDSIPIPIRDSKIMENCKLKLLEGYHLTVHQVAEMEMVMNYSANEYIPHAYELRTAYSSLDMAKRFFLDLMLNIQDGDESRETLKSLLPDRNVLKVIEIQMGFIYDFLYTKAKAIYSPLGIARRIIAFVSTLIVLVLFLTLEDKHHHSKIDLIITLVLLIVALLLELYAFRELLISDHTAHWLITHKKTSFSHVINHTLRPKWDTKRRCSNSIGQVSLLSFSLRKKHVPCYGILEMLGIDEMLEIQPYDHIPETHIADIKYLILKEVRNLTRESLSGRRGGDTLQMYNRGDLAWSVELGIDQSILIWHLATEICYFQDHIPPREILAPANDESGEREPKDEVSGKGLMRERCNYLSQYMLYLLVRRPNMLPIGMGDIKFRDIYSEVGAFIEEHMGESVKHIKQEDASRMLRKLKTEVMLTVGGRDSGRKNRSNYVIFHACKLASELGQGEEKWEIIKNVWLEMLVHVASQCRGRHHAQQLRRGGELLTNVWLLMAHFGLTYHFQIPRTCPIVEAILR